ncbi:hypothetical protein [Catellatospora vulcania]|uniref:hypothetical protein n=1 Tax=Catellatospora vulcania TaxID=1460450 RepID=UPI0012D3A853|nr:hypothetical protein [Catellatospora vulcania]
MAFLLGLDAFGLTLFGGNLDTNKAGNFGEWAAALATLVAVSITLWDNAKLRRRARETELRDLAAWLEPVRSQDGQRRWQLVIRNGTRYPVHRWVARPQTGGNGEDWHACHLRHGVLLPESNLFDLPISTDDATQAYLIDLHFSDREHQGWTIDGSGVLNSSTVVQTHTEACTEL